MFFVFVKVLVQASSIALLKMSKDKDAHDKENTVGLFSREVQVGDAQGPGVKDQLKARGSYSCCSPQAVRLRQRAASAQWLRLTAESPRSMPFRL